MIWYQIDWFELLIDDWMSNQKLIIRNKKISKQSTKLRPCQKFWQRTCQEIERQEKIAKEYNCSVPIYYTGEHLTKVTKSITSVTCNSLIWKKNTLVHFGLWRNRAIRIINSTIFPPF